MGKSGWTYAIRPKEVEPEPVKIMWTCVSVQFMEEDCHRVVKKME